MSEFTVFESTADIHLPVRRVWDLLTDWGAAAAWMPGVTYMEASEDPARPGTTLDYRTAKYERQFIIHDLIEETALVLHTAEEADSLSYRFDLTEHAGQTHVILQVTIIDPDLSVAECEQLAGQVRDADGLMLENLQRYAEKAP